MFARKSQVLRIVGLLASVGLQLCVGCRQIEQIGDLELKEVFADAVTRELASSAGRGDVARVAQLVKEGANVNAKGADNISPLCWAVYVGNSAGVEALLTNGADPNVRPRNVDTPVNAATKYPEMLRMLMEHGADVDLKEDTSFGSAPLHAAVLEKSTASMRLLIDAGANMEATNGAGWTPLYQACVLLNYEQAILLVEAGANWRFEHVGRSESHTVIERIKNAENLVKGDKVLMERRAELITMLVERGASFE